MRSIGDILRHDVMPELERRRRENGDAYEPREGDEIVSGNRVLNIDGIEGDVVSLRICDRDGGLLDAVRVSRDSLTDQVSAQRVTLNRVEHISAVLGIPPERPTQAERRAVAMDDAGF